MTFELAADPTFSLSAAADFAEGFPGTRVVADEEGLQLAWAVDGDWRTVSVTLRQEGDRLLGELDGSHPRELTLRAKRDVERMLCLDVDVTEFVDLGRHDPVVRSLQDRLPGLRPVLFFTPYEAAAWSIIGQRIARRQAAVVMRRLADELGDGGAFPSPDRLSELPAPQHGLTERKIDQLRGLAAAAREGRLDRDRLRAMTPVEALADLQQLAGIGPFSAELVLIRGVGAPDVLPSVEKRFEKATRELYALADDVEIATVAEHWRPFRSWVAFLIRAAA